MNKPEHTLQPLDDYIRQGEPMGEEHTFRNRELHIDWKEPDRNHNRLNSGDVYTGQDDGSVEPGH